MIIPNNIQDTYPNFDKLREHELEGTDFSISCHDSGFPVSLFAIHGGNIEPGTSDIAKGIAEDGLLFNLYLFEGLKPKDNLSLHITSTRFDEPQALKLAENSETVISIHGLKSEEKFAVLGGLDTLLKTAIENSLLQAGFHIVFENIYYQADSLNNIANRSKRKKGIQIELSRGLRDSFFETEDLQGRKSQKTESFFTFIFAIQKVLKVGKLFT